VKSITSFEPKKESTDRKQNATGTIPKANRKTWVDSAFGPETAQTTQLRSEREHLNALLVREKRQVTRKGIVATRLEQAH